MLKRTLTAAVAMLAIVFTAPVKAQGPAPASVHGHVNDAAGAVLAGVQVKFTTDKTSEAKDRKFPISVDTDSNGDYKASVPPGDYLIVVFKGTVQADYQTVTLKAGDDKTINFDMTREEYMKSLTPEQRQQIEDFKKKNAAASSANAVIGKLNATLKQVRADLAAAAPTKGDVSSDITQMKQAVDAKPDTGLLWVTYGDTLLAQGDHLAAADKAAGKPSLTDEEVVKEYTDSAAAYKKAIELDSAASKPNTAEIAAANNQMGTALARSGKIDDATAAFEGAAKADPTKAGMYYKNEAVVAFNSNQNDAALAAADKAIAADPNGPDPYWIKGQVLIAKSTFDQKTQKLTAPPGCVEAYQKFLELAPNDPKAPGVKEVLTSLGEKIDTKFKAGKK
ncbi:carboxypeptidase regulatory-like domain-containing protein [Granulicella paludicola]|uniref:carboxypeptidase regulatory-like domain-containing protein n=1 Tax=Granulicella paludicola TaxID=474951 RepID=UPI0021E05CDF|nr:carboxypeptidase regulatory-like domain-containing protein [Granulicella paludicola]